jgi:hypothetical protein
MKKAILVLLFLCVAPGTTYGKYRTEWHLDASVEEEYNDNITLAPEGEEEDDFITRFIPGGSFLLESKTADLLLDYHLNADLYANDSDRNFIGHSALVDARKVFKRHWTLRLNDRFILTDTPREVVVTTEPPPEVVEPAEFYIGTRQERSTYFRNSLFSALEWQYGEDDQAHASYRNELYQNEDETVQDSMRHIFGVGFDHWFGPKYGLLFDFDYQRADFEEQNRFAGTSDFNGQDVRLVFTRRFTQHTSAFIEGGFTNRSFDREESDYRVYSADIGASHAFNPRVSGQIRGGYFLQDPETGDSESGFDGSASIAAKWVRLNGSAYVRSGYTESYIDAENLGFAKFWSVGTAFLYELTRRIDVGVNGSFVHYDFPERGSRNTWQVGIDANMLIRKWLTGSLTYLHQERFSDDFSDYTNNRFLLRFTATY